MSLVGSLEDLTLGDILQIVSLSRKSGLLLLRSEEGDGRIVFTDGRVRAAYVKGEPEDLGGVLAATGMADSAVVEQALATARESGRPRNEVLAECTGLSVERLDSLRREHVERVVLRMFRWHVGEFSFDIHDQMAERDEDLALPTGINAQFLSMEAARLGDEDDRVGEPPRSDRVEADVFLLSGEAEDAAGSPGDVELPALVECDETEDAHDALATAVAQDAGHDLVGVAVEEPGAAKPVPIGKSAPILPVKPPSAAPEPTVPATPVPLVVIDRDLRGLEWIKSVVRGRFARVHIFQHSEGGVGRIRQYLMRGELPTVLVSCDVPADSLSDSVDSSELIRRLRSQAPRMPILALHDGEPPDGPGLSAADAVIARPPSSTLTDRRHRAEVEAASESLLEALEPWRWRYEGARPPRRTPETRPDAASLERLREISGRLRDPATLGDVLSLVIEFASESFERVAMFMVRDDEAVGIAQRGLEAAGGPDEESFRRVRVPLNEPACFREVLASRRPQCGIPDDDGDRQLTGRLGNAHPPQIYAGPIESGGRVAAILYADNLPGGARISDPVALTVVLHEAGLALDRALLERALSDAKGSEKPA